MERTAIDWLLEKNEYVIDTRYDIMYKVISMIENDEIFGNSYVLENAFTFERMIEPRLWVEYWFHKLNRNGDQNGKR